jgi:cell division protease FtsH
MAGSRYVKGLVWVVVIVLIILLFQVKGSKEGGWLKRPRDVSYSDFITLVENSNEKDKLGVVRGVFKRNVFEGEDTRGEKFRVALPEPTNERSDLIALLDRHRIEFEFYKPWLPEGLQSALLTVLFMVVPFALLLLFLMRQAQTGGNQALSFGRSRAKRVTEDIPKVTFDDVAGVEEAKAELEEVVEFLKSPKKFQALGAKIPKGVLLLGPPGCGKTLLARAIAGEAGVPFFHISGSDFVEMFVGVGASRVRDLFDTAKNNKPSLIFIDEIDAVGRQRGAGLGGGHDEREQTLNQLLVEMDGFDPNAGVILIAATNRPDILDPALLRPGRFDRRVVVDTPDAKGREGILKVHIKGKPLSEDVDIGYLARRTPGFSGADLANLVNEAALLAARREKSKVEMTEFIESIDRVIAGPERKSRIISDKEKEMVAYHEVGHAIVQELLPLADPVHKISILPRGMALGYTMAFPIQDKYMTSRSELLDDIAGRLAGRAADEIVFGEQTTGAADDLERATDIARRMVTEFGMSAHLGPLTFGRRQQNPFLGRDIMEDRNYGEEVAKAIDLEVRGIIETSYERAKTVLSENRETLDRIAGILLERETLERQEFEQLMKGVKTSLAPADAPPKVVEALPEKKPAETAKGKTPLLDPGPA